MAFRRLFGVRLFFVLGFGVVILILQMIALSRLNTQSPSSVPWLAAELNEDNIVKKMAKQPLEHVRDTKLR